MSPANYVMWERYSERHKGICLHYDISDITSSCIEIKPMDYTDQFKKKVFLPNQNDTDFKHLFYTKSSFYQHEFEIRALIPKYGRFKIESGTLKSILFGMHTSPEFKLEVYKATRKSHPNVHFFDSSPSKDSFAMDAQEIIMT